MSTTSKHMKACSDYRKDFLERYGYGFCEVCGVNQNGTFSLSTHHIYFASLYPKHPELHNKRNLILVCSECHEDFHGNRNQTVFKGLERERQLKQLFNTK